MDTPLATHVAAPVVFARHPDPVEKSVQVAAADPITKPDVPIEAGSDAEKDNDPLLPLLQRALPACVVSYDVLGKVAQANAEGARVVVRLVVSDGGEGEKVEELFVKRVDASLYAPKKKEWADLRRTLLYARTECRFYSEVLPLLLGRGVEGIAPKCHLAECDLSGLIGDDESATDVSHVPAGGGYDGKGGALIISSLSPHRYYQRSPLRPNEASKCLAAVAKLHASAWEDPEILRVASERLSENGGSYHLRIRNPKELTGMERSWDKFRDNFRSLAPDVFDMEGVRALGRRMFEMAEYVCTELSPTVDDPYATVVHGDYKAMNIFLPKDEPERGAIMIDYASAGVGMGMSDVAMHIAHAVRPEDLANGGEERLVDGYLDALQVAREGAAASANGDMSVRPYPREEALRHYRLAVVDYFRFILGRFYGASTPEAFEKKKDYENRTLVNRDVGAAVAFVERVDRYLAEFEEERRKEGEGFAVGGPV